MNQFSPNHSNQHPREGKRSRCIFVTDLHGSSHRYRQLFTLIESEHPAAVFLCGDLFPGFMLANTAYDTPPIDFIEDVLYSGFRSLIEKMEKHYPRVILILGNDDLRSEEPRIEAGVGMGLWEYIHNRSTVLDDYLIFGYSYVPPTPFRLKDWERYDVSRYVDPGCTHPSEGWRSVEIDDRELKYATIEQDLKNLTEGCDLSHGVFLIHVPPYQTSLDRADLDGQMIDHVPLDVHVGSIAVRRFIEQHQPYLTLHGHIHESPRITGTWKDRIGNTRIFTAAHDGPELSVVRFDLEDPDSATRELV